MLTCLSLHFCFSFLIAAQQNTNCIKWRSGLNNPALCLFNHLIKSLFCLLRIYQSMNYHLQKPSAISTYMDRLVTWCQSGFVLVRITKLHGRNCNEVWDRSFTSTAPACGCYLKQASVLADIFLMWSLHPFSFQFSFDY